jgi:hypothetical protein
MKQSIWCDAAKHFADIVTESPAQCADRRLVTRVASAHLKEGNVA